MFYGARLLFCSWNYEIPNLEFLPNLKKVIDFIL